MRGKQLMWIISVAVLAGLATAAAQEPATFVQARLFDSTGQSRVGTEVRDVRPQPRSDRLGTSAFFYQNHNVRDDRGRVVSGLAIQAWQDGPQVRVAVYTLVPRPGAPNRYLADRRETHRYLQRADFVQFALAVGQKRELVEMKRLGLDPWVVSVERVRRLVIPASAGRRRSGPVLPRHTGATNTGSRR